MVMFISSHFIKNGLTRNALAVFAIILVGIAYFAITIYSALNRPLSWDEGWNLLVAKNLVSFGYYGRTRLGEPESASLIASQIPILSSALGVKVFGNSIFSARLPFIFWSFGTLLGFFILVKSVFNLRVAVISILALYLGSVHLDTHPMLAFTQILGEFSIAPLSFEDPAGAKEVLSRLSVVTSVKAAGVYDSSGSLFAEYVSAKSDAKLPNNISVLLSFFLTRG